MSLLNRLPEQEQRYEFQKRDPFEEKKERLALVSKKFQVNSGNDYFLGWLVAMKTEKKVEVKMPSATLSWETVDSDAGNAATFPEIVRRAKVPGGVAGLRRGTFSG